MSSVIHPLVSVVIPMRNEAAFIGRCLESLLSQDYPGELELLVVDGCSKDGSPAIVQALAAHHPEINVLKNLQKTTPKALNIGVRKSRGEVVIVMGSHSTAEPDFIRRSVETLQCSGADCVGGRIETESQGRVGLVVALAMSSAFGVGNARFRTSGREGPVDTVAFGAYRRRVFDEIGPFDEELVRNQDDEFNFRLTRNGGIIYFNPAIRSHYYSRPTFAQLWRQYFQYGRWKTRILGKHGGLPSVRHIIPSTSLAFFTAAIALSFALPDLAWLPLLLLTVYAGLSLSLAIFYSVRYGPRCLLLPVAFATLHLSYATGFICGLPALMIHKRNRP